ncbi:hypothetical protein [Hymenobacter sediminicola]|uniref:Uncharacterized protein n=1 Tax=Hymenobacter sediminicola TaxID=2761579 RepID=A0A7G7W2I5_9BACT|nr:hypothetical protein [Hymenobacter sediminicola]QNH60578.1 hypothetical protein H4317_10225 [Hymenobacter sediminicola]
MNHKKKKQASGCGFNTYFVLVLLFGLFGHLGWKLSSGYTRTRLLSSDNVAATVARITNEKEFLGNSPVSHQFYYKYSFAVNSQTYSGDSRDPGKQPGDTILIRYVVEKPEINEPVHK